MNNDEVGQHCQPNTMSSESTSEHCPCFATIRHVDGYNKTLIKNTLWILVLSAKHQAVNIFYCVDQTGDQRSRGDGFQMFPQSPSGHFRRIKYHSEYSLKDHNTAASEIQ